MRSKKSLLVCSAMALAMVVLVSGCEAPATMTTGVDSFFRAEFLAVNPAPTATPFPAQPASANATGVIDPIVVSITGRGHVNQAVIDPPPVSPAPTATPVSNGSVAGNAAGGSSGSGGGAIPQPLPPVYFAPELTLDYSSAIFSDDCKVKADQAAAQGLHLIVQGEGQVTYWANGSGTGALISATKILSCDLGPSICAAAEVCVQPMIACKVGEPCTPPPCKCQPLPQPVPAPTLTGTPGLK